ncbi:membrane protein complex subunit 1 [Seminavis robusta]|uniref:ER membrane protein complex subunit 1 n=1 Tax=Seminavis robusta TaxID=568900 RepID=A0A9N8DWD6_9STRA|nr:membrane protein complex subunit 1 [Seminavis robusta]|eukprot:Sro426_g140400.1 membrane protein complex subunit 1 (1072) ;mRNA; r:27644-30859
MYFCLHRSISTCILGLLSLVVASNALFADEVGVSDFLVATTGHGPTKFVFTTTSGESVITSDSPVAGHELSASTLATSCYVASRNIGSGNLLWRRNVCSSESKSNRHTVAAAKDTVWTMDSLGVIRAWEADIGRLIWDAFLETEPTDQPRLLMLPPSSLGAEEETRNGIGAVAKDRMLLLDAVTGEPLGKPLSAAQILNDNGASHGKSGQQTAQWLQMVTDEKDKWRVLLGWISSRDGIDVTTTGSDLLLVDLEWHQDDGTITVAHSQRLDYITKQIDASSLHIMPTSGSAVALSADGTHALSFGVANGQGNFDAVKFAALARPSSLSVLSDTVARIRGIDGNGKPQEGLFQIPSWNPLPDVAIVSSIGYGSCQGSTAVAVAIGSGEPSVQVWKQDGASWKSVTMSALSASQATENAMKSPTLTALACNEGSTEFLLSTPSGTTGALLVDTSQASVSWTWTAEEGLGHISSGLVLDASHAVVVDDLVVEGDSEQEPAEIARRLEFSARLSSQWESLVGAGANLLSSSSKDKLFGFLQIAVLVSERTDRLYGMELAGPSRGTAAWTVDLPSGAMWHKLVHGTHNAAKSTHGMHGGTHAREVLVVSATTDSQIGWKCIDGTSGEVHSEGSIGISAPVVQVMPIVGGGACRQQAALMHEDHTVSLVPADSTSFNHALSASPNGFFAHVLSGSNDATARLESFQITSAEKPAVLVGQTSFPGERLIQTVYPLRAEVIQSPCTVLGDDSLLLKYLNPHLAAIVTVRDGTHSEEVDSFGEALRRSKQQTEKKQKKKPLGVTPKPGAKTEATTADAEVTKEDEPNLFVSLVDTVSGRVLYRASHANAATSSKHIQAVFSENWIVYSFVNAKTRKAEVGVLSLYEGMIHRKGLTAFTSPEQTTEFSSWDARETKPIVLAKTYSIPKPVTALGVTQTRSGISAHQILLATSEDRIYSVGRAVLEPRRPLSDLKESEKLEGLRQYSELIPLVTLQALSYNLTVHAPTQIVSAPTELESQTLVFAFGGPDLFFTRTSPSKGFDMLPESFNRILLSLLVVALLVVVVVTKRMATQKIVKHGWM